MKKLLFALFYATRVTRLFSWVNRRHTTILCYHSVTRADRSGIDPLKMHIRYDLFKQHLDHLKLNYHVITLSEFVTARRNNLPLPERSVVLTFDDGFRNFSTLAAPALLERQLPATAFIVMNKTVPDHEPKLPDKWTAADDERYLSWQEVETLSESGLEIGSHTCSHPRLLSLPAESVYQELDESRRLIEKHLSPKTIPLSYPHGQTSEEITQIAESVGYNCAVTSALGPNRAGQNLFALCRTVVAADDEVATFAARVSGLTVWLGRLARAGRIRSRDESGVKEFLPYESLSASESDY